MSSETARVAMLSKEQARATAREMDVPELLADLNVFRILLRRPKAAKAVNDLLMTLLFRAELPHRLRELVIMRIGWSTRANYEWTQHWHIALDQFGLTEPELLDVRDWAASERFDEADRAILAATDEMLETGSLRPETFETCRRVLGAEEPCIELLLAIGTWHLISHFANGVDLPLEEGVASWPPEGVGPKA